MKQIELNYYDVTLHDEGGTARPVGLFSSQEAADKATKHCESRGWYGAAFKVNRVLYIHDTFEEWLQSDKNSVRRSALSKLTHEEKLALGLLL